MNTSYNWKEELFKSNLNLTDKNRISDYIVKNKKIIKSQTGLKKAIKEYNKQKR